MTAVPALPEPLVVEDIVWMRVEDDSSPGAVRRRVVDLGERVGLKPDRLGEVAIVATEIATNLTKYAEQGRIVIRVLRCGEVGGVEVVALDSGPGMRDVRALFTDGESSGGSLGIGLGAVHRLATSYDVHSVPGTGTVLVASFWQDPIVGVDQFAGLTRAIEGENDCGDAYAVRRTDRGLLLMLADGLGHGHLAARASGDAVRAFRESAEESPAALLRDIHRSISSTRGAAIAVGHLETKTGLLVYAGVGNIAGRWLGHACSRGLVTMPGIVGHNVRLAKDITYNLEPGSWVVMHSDGLTDKWDVKDYPGLLERTPLVIAATLMRDAAVRRDDASILVAGPVPRQALM